MTFTSDRLYVASAAEAAAAVQGVSGVGVDWELVGRIAHTLSSSPNFRRSQALSGLSIPDSVGVIELAGADTAFGSNYDDTYYRRASTIGWLPQGDDSEPIGLRTAQKGGIVRRATALEFVLPSWHPEDLEGETAVIAAAGILRAAGVELPGETDEIGGSNIASLALAAVRTQFPEAALQVIYGSE